MPMAACPPVLVRSPRLKPRGIAPSYLYGVLMDQIIHVAEAQCDMPLDALDLTQIRRIYNQLADRCLDAANAVKLDLDDVILEHRAVFNNNDEKIEAAIESVGDVESWKRAANQTAEQAHSESSGPRPRGPRAGKVRCVALRINVIRQADDPLAGFVGG